MTEREKMTQGEWFDPADRELRDARRQATRLMHRFNSELADHDRSYRETMVELCPGCRGFIRAPFYCDYGFNVHIGEKAFINFGCVFLDLAPIRVGDRTMLGPKVQLLTAHHPLDAAERATGKEIGRPIVIGTDCWLGAGVIVCPGVTIGDRSIIGAGAVVTHDVPSDVVAAGNPARVIKKL